MWLETAHTVSRLARHIDTALADIGLTMAQYRLLVFVAANAERASILAERMAVSKPSLTAIVDGLVGRGLVAREHDEADRRRIHHHLTDDGMQLLADANAACNQRLAEIAGGMPERAIRSATAGAARWAKALDDSFESGE